MTTIVTRSGKGSPLTNNEVDTNFTNLNTDKLETSGGSLTGAVTVVASTAGALVRITQTGAGDALLVEDSANPDSSPFVVDATGNVGIGTTTPANKLSVAAASGAVNATITNGTGTQAVGVTSGNVGLLGMISNHELGIYTNNAECMRITNAGNVGIGTSSPAYRLTAVGGATQISPGTSAQEGVRIQRATGVCSFTGINNDNNAFNALSFATGASEAMRIDASGNVGIGTSNPGNTLTVAASGTSQIRVISLSGGTEYYDFGRDATDGFFGFSGAQTTFSGYKWSVNAGSEVMRITNAGNVGIGTSSPASKLSVSSASSVQIQATTGTVDFRIHSIDANSAAYSGTVSNHDYAFTTNNTERMRIDTSGQVLVGVTSGNGVTGSVGALGYQARSGRTGSFAANLFNINWTGSAQLWIDTTNVGTITLTSDYRIKRNIETQDQPALDRVLQLRPVTYQMADYGDLIEASDDIREGFIAHELAAVIPSAVNGEKDAPDQLQSLKIDALCSVLVKAIQELKAEFDAYKAAHP